MNIFVYYYKITWPGIYGLFPENLAPVTNEEYVPCEYIKQIKVSGLSFSIYLPHFTNDISKQFPVFASK